tara:strand:+ start:106 stop:2040 length:1935 start_codon:yes stop_codon:yes gene_type:complete
MTTEKKLLGVNPSGDKAHVAECFFTHTYWGNGGQQQVFTGTGVDLATDGGLIWRKGRTIDTGNLLEDSERGFNSGLVLATENSQDSMTWGTGNGVTAVSSDGYTINNNYGNDNYLDRKYVSWIFKKTPKFFDVVTWSGNSTARTISHDLGSAPAFMLIKRVSSAAGWAVYHKDNGTSKYMLMDSGASLTETTDYTAAGDHWNGTTPTDTNFSLGGHYEVNYTGSTYIAYLFADNTAEDLDDQMIKCGSYTHTSGTATEVSTGWEPQFLLDKRSSATSGWRMYDKMRGLGVASSVLYASSTNTEEASNSVYSSTSTGFVVSSVQSTGTYIYMAIRAPMMKEPDAATDVFHVAQDKDNSLGTVSTGFASDMAFWGPTATGSGIAQTARMLGSGSTSDSLFHTDTNGAGTQGYADWDRQGIWRGNEFGAICNTAIWKRAKGFFDVVAYQGDSVSGRTMAHSLGVVPELMIIKNREQAENWVVYSSTLGASKALWLNSTYGALTDNGQQWWGNPATSPTDTVFTLGNDGSNNTSTRGFIAYLFASLAGISKVGSYTGNGSSQTIDCGFSAGARFILIKRTDTHGDWTWWDTSQGIIAGNDPHRVLNAAAAQVTSDDSVDPANSGFIVNQVSATDINVSSATYIFYAIA